MARRKEEEEGRKQDLVLNNAMFYNKQISV